VQITCTVVLKTFQEQRADRTVDQARGQNFFFGRTAFAFEEATRDFTGGERLFLIVNREREEVLPFLDRPAAQIFRIPVSGFFRRNRFLFCRH
jgi:hypothetical protein